jgi:hypothetical protein
LLAAERTRFGWVRGGPRCRPRTHRWRVALGFTTSPAPAPAPAAHATAWPITTTSSSRRQQRGRQEHGSPHSPGRAQCATRARPFLLAASRRPTPYVNVASSTRRPGCYGPRAEVGEPSPLTGRRWARDRRPRASGVVGPGMIGMTVRPVAEIIVSDQRNLLPSRCICGSACRRWSLCLTRFRGTSGVSCRPWARPCNSGRRRIPLSRPGWVTLPPA